MGSLFKSLRRAPDEISLERKGGLTFLVEQSTLQRKEPEVVCAGLS